MSFSFLDFFFFSLVVMSTSIVICGQSFAFSLCNQAMSMMTWGYQEEMFLMLWSYVCVYHWRGPGRASAHGSAMPRLSQLKTTLITGPSLPHTCKCCAHRATVPPCQLAWLKYLTRAILLPTGHGAVEAEHAVCLRCACFHLTSIHLTPFWVNQM